MSSLSSLRLPTNYLSTVLSNSKLQEQQLCARLYQHLACHLLQQLPLRQARRRPTQEWMMEKYVGQAKGMKQVLWERGL